MMIIIHNKQSKNMSYWNCFGIFKNQLSIISILLEFPSAIYDKQTESCMGIYKIHGKSYKKIKNQRILHFSRIE